MATLVYLDTNHERGARIAAAINKIRDGLAELEREDGLRAQTIGVSAAEFGYQFGIASATEAQAFSDRWTFAVAPTTTMAAFYEFLDATVDGAGSTAAV